MKHAAGWAIGLGVVGLASLLVWRYQGGDNEKISKMVDARLAEASREVESSIDGQFQTINSYFDVAKSKTPQFAEEALGWGSKWRLLVDYVPFTSGGKNEAFLKAKFEALVLQPAELEKAIETTIQGFFSQIEAVERTLIVNLQRDMGKLASGDIAGINTQNISEEAFQKALQKVLATAGGATKVAVTKELVTLIAGEIVTAVAKKMVVSGVVLAAGGAGGAFTAGISVVIGIVVDQLISWVWDWYADPQGKLTGMINGHLDEMRDLMIKGTDEGEKKVVGLRVRLLEFSRSRAQLRESAIQEMFQGVK